MIKSSIKKFFINLKYYFTPLGFLFIVVISASISLLNGVNQAIESLVEAINQISTEASTDVSELKDALLSIFNSYLDGTTQVTEETFTRDGISSIFQEATEVAVGSIEAYGETLFNSLSEGAQEVITSLIMVALEFTLGITIGFFFTKYLVRKNTVKRTLKESLKSLLIGAPSFALELVILGLSIMYLGKLWYIGLIVCLLLFAFFSLIKAYFIQRQKGMRFKEVVNIKNMFKLYLTDILLYLIVFAISAVLITIMNPLLGALFAIPFIEIAVVQVSLVSESFICDEFKKNKK